MCVVYNLLFSHRKEGNPAICDHMDGSWGHYAKWNKSEKDKYCMFKYGELNWILRDREKIGGCQRQGGGRDVQNGGRGSKSTNLQLKIKMFL